MASKLLLFLSAFLAVQAFAWGETVSPTLLERVASGDGGRNLHANAPHVRENKLASDLVRLQEAGFVPRGNPLDCVPLISEALTMAKDVATYLDEVGGFVVKFVDDLKRCFTNPDFTEAGKCIANALKPVCDKYGDMYKKYKELASKVTELYGKFKDCFG